MTNAQRDELLISVVKSLSNLQNTVNDMREELKQEMKQLEERLEARLEEKIKESEKRLEEKIKESEKRIEEKIKESEARLNERIDTEAKATAEIFHDYWKHEEKEHEKINDKIIRINKRYKN